MIETDSLSQEKRVEGMLLIVRINSKKIIL